MSRLCDRHTPTYESCPKCVAALTQMILYASRQRLIQEPRKPEARKS